MIWPPLGKPQTQQYAQLDFESWQQIVAPLMPDLKQCQVLNFDIGEAFEMASESAAMPVILGAAARP